MGLGSAEMFSLAEARERAREAHRLLADGIDPIDAGRTERAQRAAEAAKAKDFETVAREYFDANEQGWSPSAPRRCSRITYASCFPQASLTACGQC